MTTTINGSSPSITFSDSTTQSTSAVVSGKVPYSIMPTGSVLQVVQGSTNAQVSTTGATAITTGLTATITPKFSTSTILVLMNISSAIAASSNGIIFGLYRNASSIVTIFPYANYANITGLLQLNQTTSSIYLDSPATTSATTYAVYFSQAQGSATIYSQINGNYSTITLMEIAA